MSKEKQKDKKQEVHTLTLTRTELVHLRDLFSVVLPPDAKKTLSQALAEAENRTMNESILWNKIVDVCTAAKLPVGDAAPDYVVAPTAAPPLSVFQLSSDPDEDSGPGITLGEHSEVEETE